MANSTNEQLDIFDEDMRHIGIASRGEAHQNGLWHQTFQCWLIAQEAARTFLLFQLRSNDKETHPGKLDISSAGHLLAGESPMDGIRELEEELGLSVAFSELYPLGVVPYSSTDDGKIDNEFCHVFLYKIDIPLESFRLQKEEVAALVRIDLVDVERLIGGAVERIEARGIDVDGNPLDRSVSLSDFVPQSDHYYSVLFAGVRRLTR